MFEFFSRFGRRREPFFEQEVSTELRYLLAAFPDDPISAALERLKRRSRGSSEHRVIEAAIERLGKRG